MKPEKYQTDKKLLLAIRLGDQDALSYLYKSKYNLVKQLIINSRGSEEDVKDIYQDAIIVLYKNFRQKDFALTSSISTYLYAVAKNLWLKEFNKKIKHDHLSLDEMNSKYEISKRIENSKSDESILREKIIKQSIEELKDPCKSLLRNFYFHNLSMEEIAEVMGYKNSDTVRNLKYKCMKRLRKSVTNKFKKIRKKSIPI